MHFLSFRLRSRRTPFRRREDFLYSLRIDWHSINFNFTDGVRRKTSNPHYAVPPVSKFQTRAPLSTFSYSNWSFKLHWRKYFLFIFFNLNILKHINGKLKFQFNREHSCFAKCLYVVFVNPKNHKTCSETKCLRKWSNIKRIDAEDFLHT